MKNAVCVLGVVGLTLVSMAADRVEPVKNLARSGEAPVGKLIIASDGKFYGTTKTGGTNGIGSVYRFDPVSGNITTVTSFGSSTGKFPNAELLDGGDGFLYGTAKQGGTGGSDFGTIFRVKIADGSVTKLAQFDEANSGKFPLGGLTKVGTRFYGVASEGGAGVGSSGTVFKLTPVSGSTNWDLGAFASFSEVATGKKPWGTLVDSGGGALIGTTELGRPDGKGCVFKVSTTGANSGVIQVLKTFAGGSADGANPRAGLWKSKADGYFYGTTYAGGPSDVGTIYRLSSLGADFRIVSPMETTKGSKPQGSLVEPPVADGFLYGTCSEGGLNGKGTVFKVNRDSNGLVLNSGNVTSFNTSDGQNPRSGLVFGTDGLAYGVAESGGAGGLGTIFRITAGVSLRSAASFLSVEGANPRAALTPGSDGSLFGTTYEGGSSGDGTIFKIAPDGTYSTLADFNGAGGANPYAPLVVTSDGTIYGTTYKGGSNERGTFFRLTADGTITPLIKFAAASAPRGTNPRGTLVRNGNDFFGVTEKGGTNDKGTVFKITVNPIGSATPATLTTLLDFTGTNGELPFSGLVDGGDGAYYGTTTKGGVNGFGTFFKITPTGTHTKLYDFTAANPTPGALIKDASAAVFYGTSDPALFNTPAGAGAGTVFKITSAGSFSELYDFTDAPAPGNGLGPRGITQISSNLLAGVTYRDGGSLFTIGTSAGTPTTIYRFSDNFTGALPAAFPEAAPVLALDGAVYGVTQKSSLGGGSVFRWLNSPAAAITAVSSTADDAAIARGVVNPNGETVNVFFEYGTNPNFSGASATTTQSLSGTAAQSVAADLVGLSPSQVYYIRLRAGSRTSRTFTYGAPSATTGASTNVGALVATIAGVVNPNGRETTYQFQYGLTPSYTSSIPMSSAGGGSDAVVVEASLASLQPASTYHYRVVATNSVGTTNGPDAIFITGSNSAPTAPDLFGSTTSLTNEVVIILPSGLDPDGESLTLDIENQPSFGIATYEGNSVIRYTPNTTFKGLDTFTYSVTDPSLAKAVGTVKIRNPFVSLKGNYLTYLQNTQGEPVGSLKVTVGGTGGFSGTLSFGGSFPVKGVFDPRTGKRTVSETITFPRAGKTPLVVTLRLDTTSDKGVVSGTVFDGVNTFDIGTDSRLVNTTKAPQAGRYTVWFRPPVTSTAPQAQGWATLTVSTKGLCSMAGKLGDGTPFTTAPTLRTTDSILFNVPLFTTLPASSRGFLYGELTFRDKPGSDADGSCKWKRGPQPKSLLYPSGFGPETITVLASKFTALTALPGTHRLELTLGGLEDNTTNFPMSFIFGVPNVSTGVSSAVIATLNTPEKVKFSANFKTGTFSGTFVHPDVGATTPRGFSGVLFQKQNSGIGVFLGTSTSGSVELDLQ